MTMISGAPRTEHQIAPQRGQMYQRTAGGIGAVEGYFLWGPHDKFVLCVSWEDFKQKFGSQPLTGHEDHFWGVWVFFTLAEGYGQLYVRNLCYYSNYQNPATAEAAKAVTATLAGKRISYTAYSRGEWAHAANQNLQVVQQDSSRRAAGSGWVDIIVKLNGEEVRRYPDLSFDVTETRNVRDAIPSAGDGYIIPVWTSDGDIPANGTYQFTGGDDGLTGTITANMIIGAAHQDGATGFYGLQRYLDNASQRPTFILNQFSGDSDHDIEDDVYSLLTTFCRAKLLTHISAPRKGIRRAAVADWMRGDGDYADQASKSTTYGESCVPWPWINPRGTPDDTLYVSPVFAYAGRMCARIGKTGHIHEQFVGTKSDVGDVSAAVRKLEFETDQDDSALLDDLQVCVLRSDLKGKIYLYGSWTTAEDDRFLEMAQRRHPYVVVMSALDIGTRDLVHGHNDEGYENSPGTWDDGTRSGRKLLRGYAEQGMFRSKQHQVGWDYVLGAPYTTESDIANRVARARVKIWLRSAVKAIFTEWDPIEGSVATGQITEE